jgi:hypothetical protein
MDVARVAVNRSDGVLEFGHSDDDVMCVGHPDVVLNC